MMKIAGLAYVVAETTDLNRWKTYAQEVLGMMTSTAPDGGIYVRMDDRQFRFAIQSGANDAYLVSGWEVSQQADFDEALQVLRNANVDFQMGDAKLCQLRCAQQVAQFKDPSGNRHELIWGFKSDFAHFASPMGVSGFVTGNIGMGHTVLPAPAFDETVKFCTEIMGFELSDLFNFQPAGPEGPSLPIHFFHCNPAQFGAIRLKYKSGFRCSPWSIWQRVMVRVQFRFRGLAVNYAGVPEKDGRFRQDMHWQAVFCLPIWSIEPKAKGICRVWVMPWPIT
jgi:3,4-dihydroxy-9,10-secoandrosta-1,3,5(10)-triene-9,17-dione 4,5-dioxygenase